MRLFYISNRLKYSSAIRSLLTFIGCCILFAFISLLLFHNFGNKLNNFNSTSINNIWEFPSNSDNFIQNSETDDNLERIKKELNQIFKEKENEINCEFTKNIDKTNGEFNLKLESLQILLEDIQKRTQKEAEDDKDKDEDTFKLNEIISGIQQDDPRILNYIKKHHLTPPKGRDVPYYLSNSNYAIVGGQDPSSGEVISKEILKVLGNITNGIFIESGADDGESGSNTLLLERDLNWTGILIEPQPVSLNRLYKKNRHAWIANVCTSPYNTPANLEFLTLPDYQIASQLVIDHKHYKNSDIDRTPSEFINVQCFPIWSVLAALGWDKIDYFSLDVESVEYDVLKTIPWDKIQIKVITVEVHRIPYLKEAIVDFLRQKGFYLINQIYMMDYLFAHESLDYVKKALGR